MLVCTINLDVNALVGVNCVFSSAFPAAVGCLWRAGSCTPLLDLQLLLFWYVSATTVCFLFCWGWFFLLFCIM